MNSIKTLSWFIWLCLKLGYTAYPRITMLNGRMVINRQFWDTLPTNPCGVRVNIFVTRKVWCLIGLFWCLLPTLDGQYDHCQLQHGYRKYRQCLIYLGCIRGYHFMVILTQVKRIGVMAALQYRLSHNVGSGSATMLIHRVQGNTKWC